MARRGKQPAIREDGLQLEENRRFQESFWTAQRCGWLCFLLVILAALAGLTGGGGPLARGEATPPGGFLEYPRIARWSAGNTLTARFTGGSGEQALFLSDSFTAGFTVEGVQPQPVRSEVLPGGQRLVFLLPEGAPARATLQLRPTAPGLLRVEAGFGASRPTALSILVLP